MGQLSTPYVHTVHHWDVVVTYKPSRGTTALFHRRHKNTQSPALGAKQTFPQQHCPYQAPRSPTIRQGPGCCLMMCFLGGTLTCASVLASRVRIESRSSWPWPSLPAEEWHGNLRRGNPRRGNPRHVICRCDLSRSPS